LKLSLNDLNSKELNSIFPIEIMEDKPVIAGMTKEAVLSIGDIKEAASKKLPTSARGHHPLFIL
jgi:hypothetical protein